VLTNLLRSSSGIQRDSGVYGQTGTRRRSGVVQDTGFADLIEELGVEVADEGADLAELVPQGREGDEPAQVHQRRGQPRKRRPIDLGEQLWRRSSGATRYRETPVVTLYRVRT
jgi:hypothetical protein